MSPAFEPEHGFFASAGEPNAKDGKSAGVFRSGAPDIPFPEEPAAHRPRYCRLSDTEARRELLVSDVPRPSTARRDREHDETEPNHHHSHEFESKGVHGNSPPINR